MSYSLRAKNLLWRLSILKKTKSLSLKAFALPEIMLAFFILGLFVAISAGYFSTQSELKALYSKSGACRAYVNAIGERFQSLGVGNSRGFEIPVDIFTYKGPGAGADPEVTAKARVAFKNEFNNFGINLDTLGVTAEELSGEASGINIYGSQNKLSYYRTPHYRYGAIPLLAALLRRDLKHCDAYQVYQSNFLPDMKAYALFDGEVKIKIIPYNSVTGQVVKCNKLNSKLVISPIPSGTGVEPEYVAGNGKFSNIKILGDPKAALTQSDYVRSWGLKLFVQITHRKQDKIKKCENSFSFQYPVQERLISYKQVSNAEVNHQIDKISDTTFQKPNQYPFMDTISSELGPQITQIEGLKIDTTEPKNTQVGGYFSNFFYKSIFKKDRSIRTHAQTQHSTGGPYKSTKWEHAFGSACRGGFTSQVKFRIAPDSTQMPNQTVICREQSRQLKTTIPCTDTGEHTIDPTLFNLDPEDKTKDYWQTGGSEDNSLKSCLGYEWYYDKRFYWETQELGKSVKNNILKTKWNTDWTGCSVLKICNRNLEEFKKHEDGTLTLNYSNLPHGCIARLEYAFMDSSGNITPGEILEHIVPVKSCGDFYHSQKKWHCPSQSQTSREIVLASTDLSSNCPPLEETKNHLEDTPEEGEVYTSPEKTICFYKREDDLNEEYLNIWNDFCKKRKYSGLDLESRAEDHFNERLVKNIIADNSIITDNKEYYNAKICKVKDGGILDCGDEEIPKTLSDIENENVIQSISCKRISTNFTLESCKRTGNKLLEKESSFKSGERNVCDHKYLTPINYGEFY